MMQGRLPAVAQQMLARAAATPNTVHDPLRKLKAIEEAQRKIRAMFPKLFKD